MEISYFEGDWPLHSDARLSQPSPTVCDLRIMHGECSVPPLHDAVQLDSAWLSVLLVPRSWLWHCRIYSSSQNRLECSASREKEIQQTISSRVRLLKSPVCTSIYRIHRSRCLGSNRRSAATTALRGAHIGNTGTCLRKWMFKALQVAICESCMENAACRFCNKSFTSKHDANVIVVTLVLASRRRRFALGELWSTLRPCLCVCVCLCVRVNGMRVRVPVLFVCWECGIR